VQQLALAGLWLTVTLPVPWMLLVLWFPDGRFTRPPWRRLFAAAAAASAIVAVAGYLFAPAGRVPGIFAAAPLPAGLAGPLTVSSAGLLVTAGNAAAALPLLALPALAGRYRRAEMVVRQQIRWLVAGAVAAIAGAGIGIALGDLASAPGLVIQLVTQPMPAAAITVAILRYRLWDIDLVVSQALVYAVLWAGLSALLLVPALAAGLLAGGPGALSAVGVALLVTVAFQPVRARLDRLAERMVFRHRPRGYALLTRLGEQLRAAPDLQAVGAAAVAGLRDGMGVCWAGIWVHADMGGRPALCPLAVTGADIPGPALVLSATAARALRDSAGQVAEPPTALAAIWPRPPALVVALAAGQDLAGVLACGQRPGDPLGRTDAQLLAVLGRECALALHTRRLEAQLQARLGQIESQAAELRRSRQRLVAAQDEQRRHIERDLHDGVQQQLVALAAALRRSAAAPGTGRSGPLTQLASDAEEAVFALQELARGIFPAILADQGLAAALRTQAARSPLAIRVEVAPSLAGQRLGADVESALYFVALEALANAAKHAPDATASIELRPVPGQPQILLEVHDNGPGFDPGRTTGGTGMQNMADRIAAAGGELTVDTRPGAGTWVRARVPLPAPPNVIPLPAG
jgi:signal transduction histidine kinase